MGTVLFAAAEDTLAPQELLELCGASVVSSIRSARLVVGSGTSPNTRSNRRNALVTYVSSLIHHSQHHPKHHFHSTRMFWVALHYVVQLLERDSKSAAYLIIVMLATAEGMNGTLPAWGVVGVLWGHQEGVTVEAADEVVGEAKLHQPSLVNIECLRVVTDAQVPHTHPIRHAAVKLKNLAQLRSGGTVLADGPAALLLQLRVLVQPLDA